MRDLIKSLKVLFSRGNKALYLRRKTKVIIGRAFQRLDKSIILGDNVPYSVLSHFSQYGGFFEERSVE